MMSMPKLPLVLLCLLSLSSAASAHKTAKKIEATLGTPPARCATPGVDAPTKVSEEESAAGQVETWQFHNCAGLVSVKVALPKNADASTPVVLAFPQTGVAGADEVFGIKGDAGLAYGLRFLRAGFAVVSPEVFINADSAVASKNWDTASFYEHFPQWSALGRMLTDDRSVLDVLPGLERSPSCIAAVGHSLGGYNSLFLAAFDKRVNAVVSSAGFESIATDDDAQRWARTSWFIYAPALRPFLTTAAPRSVPWDFDDLLRMIYPRPVMIVQGTDDPVWTKEDELPDFLKATQDRYKNAGLAENFSLSMFKGGHAFPGFAQDAAISMVTKACLNKR
ncbi:dienelactone hydrolase family protein [Bosea sp. (in: a-proteobacteria)]|uniref:dienelactone hydrolase family protein n=1 Tax=Bosea sp. (in: a-proteobacteria) TaxID=1871050 RepID=UPI00333FF5E9